MGFMSVLKNILGTKPPKKKKPITQMQLEISHLSPTEPEENKFMDKEVFLRIANFFDQVKVVNFSGWGDPLEHPEALEMFRIAREKGGRVHIVTEGKLLTPSLCQQIVELGIEKLTIKLCPPHNTLDQVRESLENILSLRKNDPEIILDYKLTVNNLNLLPQVLESASSLNINEFKTSNLDFIFTEELNNSKVFEGKVSDENRGDLIKQGKVKGKAEYEEIISQTEKIANKLGVYFTPPQTLVPKEAVVCEYEPLKNVFITWEGRLAPCPFLSLNKISYYFNEQKLEQTPYIVGDLKTTDLENLWNENKYEEFRNVYQKRVQLFNAYMEETFEGEPNAQLLANNYEKLDRQLLENKVPDCCRSCYKAYSI